MTTSTHTTTQATAPAPPLPITPLAVHLRGMDAGYRCHYGDPIDREVAAESSCTTCGHVGQDYRGFVRPAIGNQRRSYRAFTICPSCQHAEEF